MYRYYQTSEKGRWYPLTDSPGHGPLSKVFQDALTKGAKKLTILSVSEVVDEYTAKEHLSYRGPLYFDIDCKEDLYLAIRSAKELVHKLLNLQVAKDCILVYCSGSKGMHVLVDERVFSSGKPARLLPKIYKEMAKALFVFGVDYQVYSAGRGNSWRLANQQRADSKYRVSITLEELEELTPEIYAEYVSAPRVEHTFPDKVDKGHSPELATLFERGKQVLHKSLKDKTKKAPGLTDELLKGIKAVPPACIEDLCSGKANKSVNMNEASLQLAAYLASTGADESKISGLSARLATVTESTSCPTERARLEHIVGLVGYCNSSGNSYKFSCGGIRSILSTKPCQGCPIDGAASGAMGGQPEGDDLGVLMKEDGYYILGADGERRVSTFTLDILDYHAEQQQDGSLERRTGFKALIKAKGINCVDSAEIFMSETMWRNKASLVSEIEGITDIVFLGSDLDVHRVKNYVFSKQAAEAGKITSIYTAGIVPQKIGASSIMVYVEPEGSINQLKVRDTHYVNADIISPPKLLEKAMPQVGDVKLNQAMHALMEMNSPVNMGLMIGWHVASHFKAHLVQAFNQFPLLSIWGPAGVGKTQTAMQMCWLNGSDYTAEHSPMSAAEASPWALIDYCSSTTTVPRILDEANESKMSSKDYFKLAEILKSAWGNQAVTRGTLRKSGSASRGRTGARTVAIPISSPLVTLSEQSLTMPALQQRSVQVFLTKDSRSDPRCTAAFDRVVDLRGKLSELGKALMVDSLTTQPAILKQMVLDCRDEVPKVYDDRPRYSFAVVLAGLDVLKGVCEDLGLSVSDKLAELRSAVVDHIRGSVQEILLEKSRTEIDAILMEMALMASITNSGMGKELIEHTHYAMHQDKLTLDYRTAFPLYLQYCNRNRTDVIIKDIRQFRALIMQEPYFLEEGVIPGFASRPVFVLDGNKLSEKGIDLSMFGFVGF